MIVKEILSENLIRQYSDKGVKLKQVETEIVYDEAIDLIPCEFTYEETNQRITIEEE